MKETLSSINEPKPPSSSLHGMVVFLCIKKLYMIKNLAQLLKLP